MRLKSLPRPSLELVFFPERDTEYVHFEDAEQHPFDHAAQGFSPVNAWWLADSALLAYWDEKPAKAIWSRVGMQLEVLSVGGVQCHIAWTDADVIVAFRGTEPDEWQDLLDITAFEFVPWKGGGGVHKGFLCAHNRIWPVVEQELERLDPSTHKVWFTGHSLGAAVATLSMDRFGKAHGLYTIGSPPVGNRRFASLFDERHAGRSFRYVNHHDLVVHLPGLLALVVGNYTHVIKQKYIDATGGISTSSMSISDRLALLWTLLRARVMPLLVDHTPRRYAVHIWNDYVSAHRK